VRVRNVGVCGTDVKTRADRMGLGVIPLIICRPPIRVSPLTAMVVTSGDPGPFGLANP
jgi:hypothetical protein